MTAIDVRNNALQDAGFTDLYNTANGAIANRADRLLVDLHEAWIEDKVVRWELADIPRKAENAASQILAYALAKKNDSIEPNKLLLLRDAAISGENTLRKQYAIPHNGQPVKAEYF